MILLLQKQQQAQAGGEKAKAKKNRPVLNALGFSKKEEKASPMTLSTAPTVIEDP